MSMVRPQSQSRIRHLAGHDPAVTVFGSGVPCGPVRRSRKQTLATCTSRTLSTTSRRVAPNGTISKVAGNGTLGYSGDGGPATSGAFNGPRSVALDSAGNLYIADESNNRIRKVTPGGTISTIAGNGARGYTGDGGSATSAQLNRPRGVAVDSAGRIYVDDADNNVVAATQSRPSGLLVINPRRTSNEPGSSAC
jgi:hypothetical protein